MDKPFYFSPTAQAPPNSTGDSTVPFSSLESVPVTGNEEQVTQVTFFPVDIDSFRISPEGVETSSLNFLIQFFL